MSSNSRTFISLLMWKYLIVKSVSPFLEVHFVILNSIIYSIKDFTGIYLRITWCSKGKWCAPSPSENSSDIALSLAQYHNRDRVIYIFGLQSCPTKLTNTQCTSLIYAILKNAIFSDNDSANILSASTFELCILSISYIECCYQMRIQIILFFSNC